MRLVSKGMPYADAKGLSISDEIAYTQAIQHVELESRISMYQAVMLTKCDPEKHQEVIESWYGALNTPTSKSNDDNTPKPRTGGYSLAEYAAMLGG